MQYALVNGSRSRSREEKLSDSSDMYSQMDRSRYSISKLCNVLPDKFSALASQCVLRIFTGSVMGDAIEVAIPKSSGQIYEFRAHNKDAEQVS